MYRKPLCIQDNQHGFTLVQYDPNGPIEIWHRYSDVLKHSAPDWMDAFRWTKEHRTVPRVARMWPAQFESWWLSGNGQPPKLFVDHEIDRVYDLRQLREMMARGRQPLPPLPIPPQPKEPSLQPPPIDKVKLTPTQTRVLRLIDELTDEAREQWTGSRFTRLPRRERRRPTLNVLQRYGLIEWGCKRMGAGISHSYWRLTKAGRKVLRTAARSGQISGSDGHIYPLKSHNYIMELKWPSNPARDETESAVRKIWPQGRPRVRMMDLGVSGSAKKCKRSSPAIYGRSRAYGRLSAAPGVDADDRFAYPE